MPWIIRVLISSFAIMRGAWLLPGISIEDYFTGILAAILLSVLNTFLRPLLILLTIPVTILTLGLFLLFINAFMIILVGDWIDGFTVDSFGWAFIFSLLLTFLNSALQSIGK